MCCCCRARKATRDVLDFVDYFVRVSYFPRPPIFEQRLQERRNAAYRRDCSTGIRPVMRKPGVELQEKAKQFRSIYFKPQSPIVLPWIDETHPDAGSWSDQKNRPRSSNDQ
jgi:hypothetical protein